MPPLKVFASGCFGFGNLGDEAYPLLLEQWLAQIAPEAHLTVNTYDEKLTRAIVDVKTTHAMDHRAVSDAIGESDLVLLGGGGLFQDYEPVDPATIVRFPTYGHLGYTQITLLAKAFDVPLLIWANGIGPLDTPAGRQITKMAFENADFISLRDDASAQLLREIGVNRDCTIAPDPVFQLRPSPTATQRNLRNVVRISSDRKILGVSVRPWPGQPGWEQHLAQALNTAVPNDWFVAFFSLQGPPHGKDHEVAERIIRSAGLGDRAATIDASSPQQASSLMGQCNAFLTMRYHSLVLAAQARLPIAALAYDPKVHHLAAQLDIPNHHRIALEASIDDMTRAIRSLTLGKKAQSTDKMVNRMVEQSLGHKALLAQAVESATQHATAKTPRRGIIPTPTSQSPEIVIHQLKADAEQARAEKKVVAAKLAHREKSIAELLARIGEYDRLFHSMWTEQTATRGWKMMRLVRRIKQHVLRGTSKDKLKFIGWSLNRLRGKYGTEGPTFDPAFPPLGTVLDGLDLSLPDDALVPSQATDSSPQNDAELEIRRELLQRWLADPNSLGRSFTERAETHEETTQRQVLTRTVEFSRGRPIVIFPPTMDWNHPLFQRPHQLCLSYAAMGFRVIFISTCGEHDQHGFHSINDNLIAIGAPDPLSIAKSAAAVASSTVLSVSWPASNDYVQTVKHDRLVYEYIDELDIFYGYGPEMEKVHRELAAKADLTVATARTLFNAVQPLAKQSCYLPNAADEQHFAAAIGKPLPDDMRDPRKKYKTILGYYGALAEWFDYDLIKHVAESRPDWLILLIGFDYDQSVQKAEIKKVDNIRWIGPKPYDALPGYLQAMDVAIIPFKINHITESTSPLKLFEYMAGAKPIVTTPMPECKQYASVLIADGPDDFLKKVEHALQLRNDPAYAKTLSADAKANTWLARAREIARLADFASFTDVPSEKDAKKAPIPTPSNDAFTEGEVAIET
jgi:hypothetical protein